MSVPRPVAVLDVGLGQPPRELTVRPETRRASPLMGCPARALAKTQASYGPGLTSA